MSATMTDNRPVSPVESISSTYSPASYLSSLAGLPMLSLNDTSPTTSQKKKRSHGKSRPPGHIPRPPNAFICFRTEYIKAMEIQNSTPDVSKSVGELWRCMSGEERQHWVEMANEKKQQHQNKYPGYKYKPIHPRDENGNCIRKKRKPRAPKVSRGLPGSSVMASLSPVSAPCMQAPPYPNQYYRRRSSSVPAVLSPETQFLFHTAAIPGTNGTSLGAPRQSFTKRPSTSMDFVCAGPSASFADAFTGAFNYAQAMTQAGAPQPQWRGSHRRSISAPDLGEMSEFMSGQSIAGLTQANPLTPINPVFGSVFERFTWPQGSSASSFNLAEFTENARRGTNLTLNIPNTPLFTKTAFSSAVPSASASSISPSLESSPLPISGRKGKPLILQPAPVPMNAFEAHIKAWESADVIQSKESFSHGEDSMGLQLFGLSGPDPWPVDSQDSDVTTYTTTDTDTTEALDLNELIIDNY